MTNTIGVVVRLRMQSRIRRECVAEAAVQMVERLLADKVGICNLDTGRIEKHERCGSVRYAVLTFTTGRDAELLEKQVLAEWRSQGWRPVLDGEQSYDGWTETVPLRSATADGLWQGILELHALTAPASAGIRAQSS
ncbi:hypothetical protein AB0I10_33655 [Streptomyces sp. NPDC050636]|uniref:hypothetical protein n=1 Tax=Streptomyces sp. NPDC050636 TaxID=3154510 RepID=UPI0034355513